MRDCHSVILSFADGEVNQWVPPSTFSQKSTVRRTLDDARRIVEKYIEYYNTVRLHSAIGYVAPADKLKGKDQEIFKERDRKLEEARELRKEKRQKAFSEIMGSGNVDMPLSQTG